MAINFHVLGAFALLWAMVVPTPGANSLMVTHVALTLGRRHVVVAILGNMIGVLLLGIAAVLGMAALLELLPWSRSVLAAAGAVYLLWFGISLLRRSRAAAPAPHPGMCLSKASALRTLVLGLATALSNTQAIVFMTSIFTAAGLLDANLATGLACIAAMIGMNAAWLGLLAMLFTLPTPRRTYLRFRYLIEATIGVLFILLGGRLLMRELKVLS
jgi:threonine/homoserine/homoserine lactone efflux protein